MFNSFKLDNGINIGAYYMSDVKSIAIQVLLFGGPICENVENNGITHLIEHIVLGGTKTYSNKTELALKLEDFGVSYGGFTGYELTGFHFDVPYTNLIPTLSIINEILFKPLFNEKFIVKEKNVIYEEILEDENDPLRFFSETVRKIRFNGENHPLSFDILGKKDNLMKLDFQRLKEYYRTQFVPSNMVITLTGQLEEGIPDKNLETVLNNVFNEGDSKDRFSRPNFQEEDYSLTQYVIKDDENLSNVNVNISFPGLGMNYNHKSKSAGALLSTILTGLRTSRLFQKVREEKGLVYDISSSSVVRWRLGVFDIGFQSDAKNIPEILKIIKNELVDIMKNGLSSEEFNHAKSYLNNRTLLSFSSTWGINNWIAEDMLFNYEVLFPEDRVTIRESLTQEDIKELAEQIFNFDKVNIVVTGRLKENNSNIEQSVVEFIH